MRDDGASAFADDIRVRDFFRVAHVGDVKNHVVGVFLQRIIRRAVERRTAAVVIHAQSAADVEIRNRKTHLVQLGIEPGRFLHGLFYREDVRHLRADVEMQQLEAVAEVFGLQHFRCLQNFRRAQAELCVFTATFRPASGALAQQPRANADKRFDPELLGNGNDLPQFLQFFDDHDDRFAQLDAEHGHLDELRVLVTIANDEAAHLVLHRQPGEQFRLAADFEAELKRLARVENFLHDLAELVDLDGKHAAIPALVIVFRD